MDIPKKRENIMYDMNIEISEEQYFKKPLYYNKSSTTLDNERCIEIELGVRYKEKAKNIIEIGAVLPYYVASDHVVIDPSDEKSTHKIGAEEYDYTDKHILSISTIEHIGRLEYGLTNEDKDLAFNVFKSILHSCKSCLISWPIGFNKTLDDQVKNISHELDHFFYKRVASHWMLSYEESNFNGIYRHHQPKSLGRTIICVTKGIKYETNNNI